MNRYVPFLIVAAVNLSNCFSVFAADAQQITRPCVTLTGTYSNVKERSYHSVVSENDWINVWQRHKGAKESRNYDLYYNPLDIPYIDFDQYMVIAVFQGSGWNNAGLKAVEVLEEKERLVLRFQNKHYSTAGKDGGEQVSVYGFFVLPKSSKTVVLEESIANKQHPQPKWEERIRFSP